MNEQQILTEPAVCEDCTPIAEQPDNGLCVKCPFCLAVVNAIVSKTHISCPSCNVSVEL